MFNIHAMPLRGSYKWKKGSQVTVCEVGGMDIDAYFQNCMQMIGAMGKRGYILVDSNEPEEYVKWKKKQKAIKHDTH